jgi:hypothetical protein
MSVRHTLVYLLLGGAVGLLLHREQERGTLAELDGRHRDVLMRGPWQSGPPLVPGRGAVVFAGLDDKDRADRVFEGWPLTPGDWQVVLQNLKGYEPRQVVVPMAMGVERGGAGLEAAALALPRMTGAVAVSAVAGGGGKGIPGDLPVLRSEGAIELIPECRRIEGVVVPVAVGTGEIDLGVKGERLAVSGPWCRVPLLARYGESVVPTVLLRAVLAWWDVPVENVRVVPGEAIWCGEKVRIPIDAAGFLELYLPFTEEPEVMNADTFALPREQVEAALPAGDPQRRLLGSLGDRLVWFGMNDAASAVLRLPDGRQVSSGALTARAVAAMQSGRFLRPVGSRVQWGAEGMALLAGVWLLHRRWRWVVPCWLVAVVGWVGAGVWIYRDRGEWQVCWAGLGMLTVAAVLAFLLPRRERVAGRTGEAGVVKDEKVVGAVEEVVGEGEVGVEESEVSGAVGAGNGMERRRRRRRRERGERKAGVRVATRRR